MNKEPEVQEEPKEIQTQGFNKAQRHRYHQLRKKVIESERRVVGFQSNFKSITELKEELVAMWPDVEAMLRTPLGDLAHMASVGEWSGDEIKRKGEVLAATAKDDGVDLDLDPQTKQRTSLARCVLDTKMAVFVSWTGANFGWEKSKKGGWIGFVETWEGRSFRAPRKNCEACAGKGHTEEKDPETQLFFECEACAGKGVVEDVEAAKGGVIAKAKEFGWSPIFEVGTKRTPRRGGSTRDLEHILELSEEAAAREAEKKAAEGAEKAAGQVETKTESGIILLGQ